MTGEEKYRDWLREYVDAWIERAAANGGLLPDNVGLSGEVGEYMDGRWYGSMYGWTWPHGFYNIAMAAILAGTHSVSCGGEPDGWVNGTLVVQGVPVTIFEMPR